MSVLISIHKLFMILWTSKNNFCILCNIDKIYVLYLTKMKQKNKHNRTSITCFGEKILFVRKKLLKIQTQFTFLNNFIIQHKIMRHKLEISWLFEDWTYDDIWKFYFNKLAVFMIFHWFAQLLEIKRSLQSSKHLVNLYYCWVYCS